VEEQGVKKEYGGWKIEDGGSNRCLAAGLAPRVTAPLLLYCSKRHPNHLLEACAFSHPWEPPAGRFLLLRN
jgi:hypothetical protein